MIIKIKSHKRPVFRQILIYMLKDEDRLRDRNKQSLIITHNLNGKTIDTWVNQFKENETFRRINRKQSVKLYHEIISFHKEDANHITLNKLEEITKKYIQERNPNGLYVATAHFDKGHYHLHICASGIEYKTGKSLRLSRERLHGLKKEMQAFQLSHFPELSKSIVKHGNKEKAIYSQKEFQMKLRTGRESNKDLISAILKTCYKKAISKETFFDLLKECNLKPYDRGGKTAGIIYERQKYRFNKFGFTPQRLDDLEISNNRKSELGKLRERKEAKEIDKGRNEMDVAD